MEVGKFSKSEILFILFLLFSVLNIQAQKNKSVIQAAANGSGKPPPNISFSTTGTLDFGTFTSGPNGGTITVALDGSYVVPPGGDIKILPFGTSSGSTLNVYAPPNTSITIESPTYFISGSNGGSVQLDLSFSQPLNFIVPSQYGVNNPFPIQIGGTLTVDSPLTDVPGIYSDVITINFIFP